MNIKLILNAPCLLLLMLIGMSTQAFAHRPNDSKISLNITATDIEGQALFQMDDLEWVVGIDDNRDKKVTWQEFKTHLPNIQQQFTDSIQITRNTTTCQLKSELSDIKQIADRTYAEFSLQSHCPSTDNQLTVEANYLTIVDPQHQLFLSLNNDGKTTSTLLTRNNKTLSITGDIKLFDSIKAFIREGIWHIFTGYDHILFIMTLIFASLFGVAMDQQKTSVKNLLLMISSFTIAHSVTLIASALDWIRIPSQWVESAIAATVIFAALNVRMKWVAEKLWALTFSFGLIHGMGFANALRELSIPEQNFISSLVSFNIGVEIGQLVLVGISLPLLFLLAKNSFKLQQQSIKFATAFITCFGIIWFIERVANVEIFGRLLTGPT